MLRCCGVENRKIQTGTCRTVELLSSAVNAQIKAPADDKPTIGLLLCKSKDRFVAEYALSGIEKPMGVVEYQLGRVLPEPLDTCLPSIEEIETALSD